MSQMIDRQLFKQLLDEARNSPRKRAHRNLHQHYEEPVQRVCIGLVSGTYVPPHAHPQAHQWELILSLQGRVGLVIFDASGCITRRHVLSEKGPASGIQLLPDTWHTLYPIDPESIILEIKQGPYDPAKAARFAAWAPTEGAPEASRFLEWVSRAETGSSYC